MSSIDERVVQMKFDNAQFQKGVADTNNSLSSLKQSLNLDGAAKSLDGLQAAGSRFSLDGIGAGVEAIGAKFSALSVLGITALVNIGNQAINTGIELVKSLTIAPIADGYNDYTAKLTSVQTIMNATGASLDTVSGYFSQLDTYADKTIYNLSDMTGAFAKFTNAGIGMDKSVPAIKGIANMVALAGQDAGAASIAMYNLSQSMAGGFLTTTDYKSLNLANVATKEWKDQMIAGAVAAGTLTKVGDKFHIIGTKASAASTAAELFNDDLKEGWATTAVMTDVLGKYGDTSTDIGKKAQAAAQDVKSWGMMLETLGASVGTGWTDTFELLLGNITESKALFTPLTSSIGGFLDEMSKARNEPLKEWKNLGGRTALIEAAKSAFEALMGILTPIRKAFSDVFPPTTGKQLMDITNAVKDFTAKLKPNQQTMDNIQRTFEGVFAVLDIGRMIIMKVIGLFGSFFGEATKGSSGILNFTAAIGDWLVNVRNALKNGEDLNRFFSGIGTFISGALSHLRDFVGWIGSLFSGLQKVDTSGATAAIGNVTKRVDNLKEAGNGLKDIWNGFADIVKKVFEFFAPLGQKIAETAGKIGTGVADAMKGVNFNTVLDAINTGLFAGLVLMIRKFFKGFGKETEGSKGILTTIKETLGGLTDTLKTMQGALKAATLLMIAAAVAILVGSILVLSTIDSGKVAAAIGAIGALMTELMVAMAVMGKISSMGGAVKITVLAIAMSLFAIAIGLLVISVKALSTMSWGDLVKGLGGVLVLLFGIAGAMKLMSGVKGNFISAGIGMIAIAIAIKILASAVRDFSSLSWKEMIKGLGGVGAVLGALAIFSRVAKVNKGAMAQGAGLILLAVSLKIIASVVKDFGELGVKTLVKGLGSLTLVLAALAVFSRIVNPSQMVSMGVAMVILGGALKIIASAVRDFASMSVKELGKGLGALAGALTIVAFAMKLMPKNMLVTAASLVIVGAALKIIASAVKDMSGMSWEEIAKGMVVLAASLAIIVLAMYGMEGAIGGAFALIVVAGALAILTPVLIALGNMSWEAIAKGLLTLAVALGIIGLAGLLIGPVVPALLGLGAAMFLLGAGAALVGVGLLAFSVGLTALAIAGAAGTAALIAIVSGLLGLIPMAFTQLGLGILAFAAVIANGAPAMVGALVAVLTALITAITTVIPLIVNAFVILITALVNAIVTLTPLFLNALTVILLGLLNVILTMTPAVINTMIYLVTSLVNAIVGMTIWFVDAGMRLIIGIINGIASRIGQVIDAGANLIVEFLNGIGRNIPKVTQAAADLIITFINSLATTIRNNTTAMNQAGANLAGAIIEGMTSGITNGVNAVVTAAKNMAKSAFDAAKDFLQINSPSKIFRTLGYSTGEGFVQGIDRYGTRVANASENMGITALDSLKTAMSNIAEVVATDIDSNPTIKPILDLSDIKKNADAIGGLIAPPTLAVDGSYAKAASLLARERVNQEAATATSNASTGTGDQLTYIQNITSPKAVSPTEVYRGTKSQLSLIKLQKKGAPV